MKKYFELSGTIDGMTYFLRNLLLTIGGFLVGYGFGKTYLNGESELAGMLILCMIPLLWIQFATIYKRVSALFPNQDAKIYSGGLLILQIFTSFLSEANVIKPIFTLSLVIIAFILIFKNSNIENHEG